MAHEHHHDHDALLHAPRLYDSLGSLCTLGATNRVMRRAAERVALHDPVDVLDVGSGTGNLALAIARRLPDSSVVGVEPSAEMLEHARSKGSAVEFRLGYAQALPADDDTFDVVTMSLALHHVAAGSVGEAIAEMRRVLRPGGTVLVLELDPIGWWAPTLLGRHATPVDSLIGRFEANGFVDVQTGRMTPRVLGWLSATAPA